MEFLIIIGLIILNGLFSMSEIAVVSARKSSLKKDAKQGNKAAQSALDLSENPNNFLSTIQVGITLIGIVTGMYSGDVLAGKVSPWVVSLGVSPAIAYPTTKIVIVILVTYLTIVFGELLPKRIGMGAAEKISKLIARPMNYLSYIAYPFVWILSKSTSGLTKLFGIKEQDNKITEEEIKTLIREGAEDGEVQQVEQDIMERVFNLGDRDLESIMTPRREVEWINANFSKDELQDFLNKSDFSKYPVAEGDLEHIIGIVHVKDIFKHINSENFNINKLVKPVHYFYESKQVYSALEQMKQNQDYFAIITDEFGTLSGIVSLKDIMEAIIGDMPELDEDPEIIMRKENSYLIDGQIPFYNFLQYFKQSDLYSLYDFNTLGGLILEELEHIPKAGEDLAWRNFHIEIIDMDGPRIDKVLVTLLDDTTSPAT